MSEDDQNWRRLERDELFDGDLGDFSLGLLVLLKKPIFLRWAAKCYHPETPEKRKKSNRNN